jgi:hypothetical protein
MRLHTTKPHRKIQTFFIINFVSMLEHFEMNGYECVISVPDNIELITYEYTYL